VTISWHTVQRNHSRYSFMALRNLELPAAKALSALRATGKGGYSRKNTMSQHDDFMEGFRDSSGIGS
jgi:hypothetical protein